MDTVKIGKFIAQLRHEAGLTQQQLGECLGVTNKTISRWENGNYMPDIEMVQLLAKTFHVSINEILAGQRLSDDNFREQADENIVAVSRESAFTFLEKKEFWIQKWRKENTPYFLICMVLCYAVAIAFGVLTNRAWLIPLGAILCMAGWAWHRNQMMIYVEDRLFDGKEG